MLAVCQQIRAIPMKRAAPAETHILKRDEVEALMRHLPNTSRSARRDRALLLLFLDNTGARVQEVAELRIEDLHLGDTAVVRLHGKSDKRRTRPSGSGPRGCWPDCSTPPARHRPRTCRSSVHRPARRRPAPACTRSCGATPGTLTTPASTAEPTRTYSAIPRQCIYSNQGSK